LEVKYGGAGGDCDGVSYPRESLRISRRPKLLKHGIRKERKGATACRGGRYYLRIRTEEEGTRSLAR